MSRSEQDRPFKNGAGPMVVPDPEVIAGASRRRYSQAYKLRILAEAEQCQRGEVGALLRREGLYSSMLSKWRQQQAAGRLERPEPGREDNNREQAEELRRLRREIARLQAELARAEAIIEVQKKLSALLETMQR